ncbi:MAG: hypothetical protein Q9160_006231 [Pyrenula sp. 1 TL-2023]
MFSLLSTVLLLSLSARSLAAPALLQSRAIAQPLFDQLNLFEQFSAAAYCPGNNDSPNSKLTCAAGNCPLVEAADTETLAEFQNSLVTDVTGYVAVDHTNSHVVVGFRGSSSLRNYIADLDFPLVPADICAGCLVHDGFWNSWLEARDGVMKAIMSIDDSYPDYSLVVTGHSLGAAIATIAAAQLRNEGHPAALYTYGSPRVGQLTFAEYVTNQPGGNYRVTHTQDPVPRLPPIAIAGYSHTSPEYFISSPNDVTPTPNDITQFDGINELNGNAGQLGLDVSDHGWYFNAIGACADFELFK